MSEHGKLPAAVTFIGIMAATIGLLLLSSGLMRALDSTQALESSAAVIQMAIGVATVSGARALLLRRRWGSLVIQGVAIVFLVCMAVFEVAFLTGAIHSARVGMPRDTATILIGLCLMVSYAVPLLLAVRILRKADVRAVLK